MIFLAALLLVTVTGINALFFIYNKNKSKRLKGVCSRLKSLLDIERSETKKLRNKYSVRKSKDSLALESLHAKDEKTRAFLKNLNDLTDGICNIGTSFSLYEAKSNLASLEKALAEFVCGKAAIFVSRQEFVLNHGTKRDWETANELWCEVKSCDDDVLRVSGHFVGVLYNDEVKSSLIHITCSSLEENLLLERIAIARKILNPIVNLLFETVLTSHFNRDVDQIKDVYTQLTSLKGDQKKVAFDFLRETSKKMADYITFEMSDKDIGFYIHGFDEKLHQAHTDVDFYESYDYMKHVQSQIDANEFSFGASENDIEGEEEYLDTYMRIAEQGGQFSKGMKFSYWPLMLPTNNEKLFLIGFIVTPNNEYFFKRALDKHVVYNLCRTINNTLYFLLHEEYEKRSSTRDYTKIKTLKEFFSAFRKDHVDSEAVNKLLHAQQFSEQFFSKERDIESSCSFLEFLTEENLLSYHGIRNQDALVWYQSFFNSLKYTLQRSSKNYKPLEQLIISLKHQSNMVNVMISFFSQNLPDVDYWKSFVEKLNYYKLCPNVIAGLPEGVKVEVFFYLLKVGKFEKNEKDTPAKNALDEHCFESFINEFSPPERSLDLDEIKLNLEKGTKGNIRKFPSFKKMHDVVADNAQYNWIYRMKTIRNEAGDSSFSVSLTGRDGEFEIKAPDPKNAVVFTVKTTARTDEELRFAKIMLERINL